MLAEVKYFPQLNQRVSFVDTYPVLVKPISLGTMGFIPQWYTVMAFSPDKSTLMTSFGTVINPSSSPTNVLIEISYFTGATISYGNFHLHFLYISK